MAVTADADGGRVGDCGGGREAAVVMVKETNLRLLMPPNKADTNCIAP